MLVEAFLIRQLTTAPWSIPILISQGLFSLICDFLLTFYGLYLKMCMCLYMPKLCLTPKLFVQLDKLAVR